LNADVDDNNHVQENVKDGEEVNIKLTLHSNKLMSWQEESDYNVNLVADKGSKIKDVVVVLDIG